MKRVIIFFTSIITFQAFNVLIAQTTSENIISLKIDSSKTIIEKDIYGHFAEHLGRCIYDGIWVGEKSSIPNINGYRKDIIFALKDLNIPLLRWPGGCFADTYHWKDGIGPKEKRASIVNVNWGGVTEDNSFGTHEFLNLCEILGCDAYVSGNVGSGTVQEMAEWAEYMTSSNESPMTKLRKHNGREKPWNVKYFGIGNEAWGCGGDMTAEYYANVCKQFGLYLNYANNKMIKVASGGRDSDFNHWTEVAMKDVGNQRIQGLSLHYYTFPGDWNNKSSATDFNEILWFITMKKTLKMDTIIQDHKNIMNTYDKDKKVGLMVDEWGVWCDVEPGTNPGFLYQQNSLRDALVAAINLNIFNNHADRVKMSNIAQIVNVLQSVILTKGNQMVLTPTYYVYKMYKVHQNARLIPLTLISEKYSFNNEFIASLSASASIDVNGKIHITIANLNPNKSIETSLLVGKKVKSISKGEIITSKNINDFNDFEKAEKVNIKPFDGYKIGNSSIKLFIPSKSIILIEL
jgi:alpha-N-arabinofuranosidase